MDPELKQQTSIAESAFIGGAAGIAEIALNHPLWVMKTRIQNHYPFTLSLGVLYKGILAHATSEVGLCVIQVVIAIQTQETLNKKLTHYQNQFNLDFYSAFLGGFLGGGISALITNPTELIMTIQQKRVKHQTSMLQEHHHFSTLAIEIAKKYNPRRLFSGFTGTSLREAFYTAGFFAGTPALTKRIEPYFPYPLLSMAVSGATVGLGAAIITHPFDTLKTVQHGEADNTKACSLTQAFKKIYTTRGVLGFFDGLVARASRVALATSVIGTTIELMRS
ncbi:MAG: hypothetical protein A3I12_03005 [Gammaproteobacteria bacterium RIFCSPLOWO2_02_FULL_38_11]|nr:MAG: hypothetical protein A3B69_00675 [Gammaproteobacteria bacterium RIFCSPHIGHO2_02_FULL_38_33]OGT23502.1 MAG: hypothetical protein A2W47_05795 [Gammaproteobacteria bacterium RIFCSPHIGHO2_12_38_15]OGT69582.1 MAG: hypothetical protein A3I12_03005 [Gammaproteobacteria bacterium RIFCSPLOWO2_02_FULL_38_11]OGT75428.1 MAG: hypothetical protein A3G71_06260 [Gammaproteobacteria bacterium RIFCSPLOWO2_12_FULL_38_14]